MKRVCIIGYNGVGAAHAVAVHRSSYGIVTAIVDNDWEGVMDRIFAHEDPPKHENKWGSIHEVSDAYHGISILHPQMLGDNPEWAKDFDLIIIATPTEFKKNYVDAALGAGAKRILVEKPFPQIRDYDWNKVSIGYEWIHHPKLDQLAEQLSGKDFTIAMFHNEPTKDHHGGPMVDLLPHCISLKYALQMKGCIPGHVEYNPLYANHVIVPDMSTKLEHKLLSPGTWIYNNYGLCEELEWDDLFDYQLLNLDKYPQMSKMVESRMRDFQMMNPAI